ncbi:hypothetical protein Back11_02400 [Paenibacillus baekrokdamisoli]|uniref:Uncharacterized protein n=1 Tax=Paenibacillus baekrokdamisoli TaxID=1712516 RepID=A0A3G9ISE5_9BACL|nr:TlpA disulfide reductase family protein [Paenibacillus baekrokdamisoli]MBB3069128.1 thiol-disulfide isomerase/thioredoxin [Paenibacillus baekrokdamisoli]BBH18895.1 hypothetical protein Back11_02400 [Paenibacillus baekrokdamisoli]
MKIIRRIVSLVGFLLILCTLVVVVTNNLQNKDKKTEVILKDVNGVVNTMVSNGKPSVLLFFTSWCPYCNEDAPKIVSMYEKYKNDINIYGINLIHRDDVDEVKNYIKKYKIEYPVLFDDDGKLYDNYGSPGFPTLIFLDENEQVTERIVGSTEIGLFKAMSRLNDNAKRCVIAIPIEFKRGFQQRMDNIQ